MARSNSIGVVFPRAVPSIRGATSGVSVDASDELLMPGFHPDNIGALCACRFVDCLAHVEALGKTRVTGDEYLAATSSYEGTSWDRDAPCNAVIVDGFDSDQIGSGEPRCSNSLCSRFMRNNAKFVRALFVGS